MRRRLRMLLFAFASAAALWAAFDAAVRLEPSAAAIAQTGGTATKTGNSPPGAAIVTQLPARASLRAAGTDPFRPRAADASRSVLARRAPQIPAAPPLPYRFVGRVYQDSGTQIFVARGAKVFAVSKGDVLDGEYRVDVVSATELAFIHLPSGSRQVMQFTPPIEDERRIARDASGPTTQEASGPARAPVPQAAPSPPALRNWNDSLTLERRVHAAPAKLE